MAEPGVGGAGLKAGTKRGGRLSWDEYSARWAVLHAGVDPNQSSVYVRTWLRLSLKVGQGLWGLGLRPGDVTVAGLLFSLAVPIVSIFGGPWLFVAAAFVFFAALADSADGAVALITDRTSRLGSYYDSMADRLSEAAWLLALWLVGVPGVLVTAAGALAWLHEYARARATVCGMSDIGVVTVAERPTRVLLVILAFLLGGAASLIDPQLTPGAVTVVVAVWFVLGLLGAGKLAKAIRAALR